VDSGAQAIRDFNVTAQRFGQIVGDMPGRMRWEAELLAFELEQRPTVSSARASLEELAASSATFSRAIEALPQSLREQASALIQQVESSQGELRKTLAEARGLIGDASGSGATLQPLADSLERTAAQVQQAGLAWTALVEELRKTSASASGRETRPFDVLEYERTAAQITSAAGELRGLVADLHGLDPVLDRVEGGGRVLVNLAAWRLFELLLVFFALLFLYRRVEALLVARRDSGAESR
jgi:DNA repair ATPase RecN